MLRMTPLNFLANGVKSCHTSWGVVGRLSSIRIHGLSDLVGLGPLYQIIQPAHWESGVELARVMWQRKLSYLRTYYQSTGKAWTILLRRRPNTLTRIRVRNWGTGDDDRSSCPFFQFLNRAESLPQYDLRAAPFLLLLALREAFRRRRCCISQSNNTRTSEQADPPLSLFRRWDTSLFSAGKSY